MKKKYSFLNPSTPQSIAIYRELIDMNAKYHYDSFFENDGDEYAQAVFQTIFKYAENEVKIMCGSMHNGFTSNPDYLSSLEGFLDKQSSSLYILMNDYNETSFKNSEVYKLLRNRKDKVNIKRTIDYCYRNIDTEENEVHFCVADDRMFRFEIDIDKRKAECNFGDEKTAKELSNSFNNMFSSPRAKVITL